MNNRCPRRTVPSISKPLPLADLRTTYAGLAAAARIGATYAPCQVPRGSDVVGFATFAALSGGALGEGLGALLDEGDGETTDLLRVLGALAGTAFGLAMVSNGWRLRVR